MKKEFGFTSFEFYLVISVIGIIMLVGLQRYWQLAEQTQRLAFEVQSQHFSTAIYNLRAKWMLSLQFPEQKNIVEVEGHRFQFSREGWPLAEAGTKNEDDDIDIPACAFLWQSLQQNPLPISYQGGDAYGSRVYHLSLTAEKSCRFEFITEKPAEYYFDYSPKTGQVILHSPASAKNN